jgi:hypothetical protein
MNLNGRAIEPRGLLFVMAPLGASTEERRGLAQLFRQSDALDTQNVIFSPRALPS